MKNRQSRKHVHSVPHALRPKAACNEGFDSQEGACRIRQSTEMGSLSEWGQYRKVKCNSGNNRKAQRLVLGY